ncbi:unnamed protein product [Mytilus edulis]|uniref:Uncharacterized protein n=1 Tax=Mytilus edulis TaxID=6550 RepID=A0A8S3SFL0_MYTED|nr:unnamed protein product [Mytilus edulis]
MMGFQTILLSVALTIMTVAAYTPTEKKLDSVSVLDVIDANRRSGSDRRSSAVSGIIRSSSFQRSAGVSSNDGINRNCHYECGENKLCSVGQKCVRDGCDSYCVQVSSGSVVGASRLSESIRRGNTVSEIIRGSSSDLSRLSSIDGSKCSYGCGENKLCGLGLKCVHEGCNSYCVQISSGSRIGLGQSLTGRLDLSNNGHLETIGSSGSMSGHTGSDILDAISARRSGMDALNTISSRRGGSVSSSGSGIVSQLVVGGDPSDCRRLCNTDSDCAPSKYCTTVDCHRICRRRPSKGYSG